jgi:hypothetical protein
MLTQGLHPTHRKKARWVGRPGDIAQDLRLQTAISKQRVL